LSEQAQITVLRYPDNVRLRKEMYLIDPNHCLYEIIDNAVDEFSAGRCKNIKIHIEEPGPLPKVSVKDDGGGIPTSMSTDPEFKGISQVEVAMTTLHAGGKFSGKEGAYSTNTAGLHGVGASCVNAVSESFDVNVVSNNQISKLSFEKGIKKYVQLNKSLSSPTLSGTSITFKLDHKLWSGEDFDFNIIKKRLKQLTYLNPGLTIKFTDYKKDTETYFHENGLSEYFSNLTDSKEIIGNIGIGVYKKIIDEILGNVQIDIIFGYNTSFYSETYSFVNNVSTQSGDHVLGFNSGIVKTLSSYLSEQEKYKSISKNLTGDDCKEGLISIISVKVKDPKFEGQGKTSIKMPQLKALVNNIVYDEFKLYLDQHPNYAKTLIEKIEKAINARIAAKRARDAIRTVKNALESSLPGKLKACSEKDPKKCEIFLVEGDSAAGSAIQGRNSKIQAILPVFGKILNVEKVREDEVLKNGKLLDVIKALKCGIGKTFDISKLRYHKIIIMADSDPDGSHIASLWITFFYRHMPEIINNGHLYIAISPIYRVTEKINGKKEIQHYFYNDIDFKKFKTKNACSTSYLKGLGELTPQQLWESTMDPDVRHIVQVTAEDAEHDSKAIEICMGDNVELRKKFILNNIKFEKEEKNGV